MEKEGAASCVLVPPFNCIGKNYDDNYISKLANISHSGIKTTIERELKLSKIFKKLSKEELIKNLLKTILYLLMTIVFLKKIQEI